MTEEIKTYSEDYVKELREEAKTYRLQLRELQSTIQTAPDPQEVITPEPVVQPVSNSVPTPAEPISAGNNETLPKVKTDVPSPLGPQPTQVGVESKSVSQLLRERNVQELEKDPVARLKVRDFYRNMLRTGMYSG
jgi:hypothetical protein